MILLREVQDKDLEGLRELAGIPGIYNLPKDPKALAEKINQSKRSFSGAEKLKQNRKYIFVAEDLMTNKIMGTSMISSQHGSPKSPHIYFELNKEKRKSRSIKKEVDLETLQLKSLKVGPSEIGGLVVSEEHRNNPHRVGRQLSFVRFLYLATHKSEFKKKIIAELLPPLNKKELVPLWEALGKKFTGLTYEEADELCKTTKEFVFSLFPKGKIYLYLLPSAARNSIGKISPLTQPVYHMLTKIGFKYTRHIDPFDGGPHLWADVEELIPIKKTKKLILEPVSDKAKDQDVLRGLVCSINKTKGKFRAVDCEARVYRGRLYLESQEQLQLLIKTLKVKPGHKVFFMPYY